MAKFILSGFADEIAPDLDSQIKGIRANNLSYIEMRNVNGRSLLQHSITEVKEIKKELDDNGIKLSSIGSYLGKQNIEEPFTHLEELKYTLEIADVMEVNNIRMFSFFIPEGKEPKEYRGEVLDRWHKFLRVAEDSSVMLLHENEKGIYGDIAERCLDIVEQMNNDLMKLIFDPANFVQCGVTPYPNAWNILKNHVKYFHIKDALTSTGEVVPAGMGNGNIPEMLKEINTHLDCEFFLSLEPHLANFQGFSDLENGDEVLPVGDNVEKFTLARTSLEQILKTL